MATFGDWILVSTPPEMTSEEYGWPKSKEVLIYDGHSQRVAFLEQMDEDVPPRWRSACSEGWILKNVTHWMPLPPDPK